MLCDGVSLWLVVFLPVSGSQFVECAVIVLEVWPEASGRKSSILNKAVTVDTDTPFKGWQGVQDILSLSMLSFHVLKRGLLPLVTTKFASFLTKNLPVTVLKHSPPFHAYLKI